MAFTKNYQIEPTKVQKDAIKRVYKNAVVYYLTNEQDVKLVIKDANVILNHDKGVIVTYLEVQGKTIEQRIIGKRGGVQLF